jgi:hypothetical protein
VFISIEVQKTWLSNFFLDGFHESLSCERFYNSTQPHNYFDWKIYLLNLDIFPTKNQDIGFYIMGTIGSKIWNIASLAKLRRNNRPLNDG